MSLYYGAGSIGSALLVVGACELLPFPKSRLLPSLSRLAMTAPDS